MNNIKKAVPYVIINTIIFGIIGVFIGKNLVEIHNTRKRINNDSEALKKFIEEMGGSATCINIKDIDKSEVPENIRKKADDPKDPDPLVLTLKI